MKIITVTGFKGGVAKSMTAIHLAVYFSDLGRTLLVDGDPNHTAVAWANRGRLPFEVVSSNQSLKAVAGKDWVVFDTPARPNSEDMAELISGCDFVVLPTGPDIIDIHPMLETVKAVGRATYGTLITRVPPKPNRDGEVAQEELAAAGYRVFRTMIRRSIAFSKAGAGGVPVRDLDDPRLAAFWSDYADLGDELRSLLS